MNDIKRDIKDIVNELLFREKREDFLELLSYVGIFIHKDIYFIPNTLQDILVVYIDGSFVVNPRFVDREMFCIKLNEYQDKWGENDE